MDISIDIRTLADRGTATERVAVAMEMIRRHGADLGLDLTRVTNETTTGEILTGMAVLMIAAGQPDGDWQSVAAPMLEKFSIGTLRWEDRDSMVLAEALGIYTSVTTNGRVVGYAELDAAWRTALGLTGDKPAQDEAPQS